MAKYRRDILTIHLNDYFQGGALSSVVPRRHWPRFERRIERTTRDLLDLLDRHNGKATFFANGWIADNAAEILHEITARGHEIASTGYYQRTLAQMSPAEFRADAVRSRHALERACGREVLGYRIARGWVTEKDLWILDILSDEGFPLRHQPVRTRLYQHRGPPRRPARTPDQRSHDLGAARPHQQPHGISLSNRRWKLRATATVAFHAHPGGPLARHRERAVDALFPGRRARRRAAPHHRARDAAAPAPIP